MEILNYKPLAPNDLRMRIVTWNQARRDQSDAFVKTPYILIPNATEFDIIVVTSQEVPRS